jgi:hypothetical protein
VGRHSYQVLVPARQADASRSRRVGRVLLPAAVAALVVLLAASAVVTAVTGVSALEGALGHGTAGYFVAQRYSCDGSYYQDCGWSGLFERASGQAIASGVAYQGNNAGIRAGTRVPVIEPPGDDAGIVLPSRRNWAWAADMVAALGVTGIAALISVVALRRRRALAAGG